MLDSRLFPRVVVVGLSCLLILLAAAGLAAPGAPAYSRPFLQSTLAPGLRLYLPLISRNYPNTEWSQHAHNAQRTSFTSESVPTPWRWKWAWNGPNSSGGISSGKFRLPRNSQPVTGGGRVYIAAGNRGVYALNQSNGAVAWNRNPGGSINSTPAYDGDTNAVFVVSSNGTLYKLNADTGNTLGQFATGSASTLPLPPAVISDRVFFSLGNRVYAVSKTSLTQIWSYDAGAPVHTPPAYSPSRNRVIAVSSDLYVHAINNADGGRAWRVKPTPRTGGNPGDSNSSVAEAYHGWPVIAEVHGYVLVKLRLDWQSLWLPNPWPSTNAAMRSFLQSQPAYQALLVLDLDDGTVPFIANVGHGGYGDGGYMPMGPQPVVKQLPDGQEVAYVVMRGSPCLANPCDGRWDSRLGEMLLDGTTVPGYQAGDVRFIQNTFFPTDEQANLTMAGNQLLAAHWEAGIAHQIVDRSASRGTGSNPITTMNLPHIVTSQDSNPCGSFSASHYCGQGLVNTRPWPGGFYIYWQQGAVYDRYWSEYAAWVVSNGLVLFVSTDGAVVALEAGNPTGQSNGEPLMVAFHSPAGGAAALDETGQIATLSVAAAIAGADETAIPYDQAASHAGQVKTVEGVIRFVFNNRKAVYLGFQNPHQGAFKVRIMDDAWGRFAAPPENLYAVNQRVRVTGLIQWYQGDPVIYVTDPAQIEVLGD